jgi:hypothetical protein
MLYFPQLATGALTQLPFKKTRVFSTVATSSADGRMIKSPDYGSNEVGWELRHTAMTDAELDQLELFFGSVEGRLNSFTFLDPSANLLRWSEDPTESVWTRGPLLQLSGTSDPFGSSRATRLWNSGAVDQTLEQVIAAPGWFQYCFSVLVRSSTPTDITVYRTSGVHTQAASTVARALWTRVFVSGRFDVQDESVSFGVRLGPGKSVDLFGFQAEAQLNPSPYRSSTTRSGVYPGARFADDSLRIVSDQVNQHSASIRIVAATGN